MRPALSYMKRRHALGHLAMSTSGVLFAACIGCMLAGDIPALLAGTAAACMLVGAWWTR